MRAYITDRGRQAGRDLPLHVEVPLLDVIALGLRFHKSGGEHTSLQRRVASRLRWLHPAECTGWIGAQNPNAGQRVGCRGSHGAYQEKRRLDALLGVEVSRQRQDVEYRGAATDSHLPVAARVPGKTESRLKIMLGGVREIRGRRGAAWLSKREGKGGVGRAAVG